MLNLFARFLQLIGLIILPLAVAGNVVDQQQVNLKQSLTMSAIGMIIFFLGWLLQRSVKP